MGGLPWDATLFMKQREASLSSSIGSGMCFDIDENRKEWSK
jgi:hypothetical protein